MAYTIETNLPYGSGSYDRRRLNAVMDAAKKEYSSLVWYDIEPLDGRCQIVNLDCDIDCLMELMVRLWQEGLI